MSFGQAVSAFFANYANFRGRTRRSGYWWVVLFVVIVSIPLALADMALFGGLWPQNLLDAGFGPASAVFFLVVAIPSLSLGVRRLHDTGRAGWWILLPAAPGIAQSALVATGGAAVMTSVLSLVLGFLTLAASIILLIFYVKDSQPGDNAYGPNPKGVESAGESATA